MFRIRVRFGLKVRVRFGLRVRIGFRLRMGLGFGIGLGINNSRRAFWPKVDCNFLYSS